MYINTSLHRKIIIFVHSYIAVTLHTHVRTCICTYVAASHKYTDYMYVLCTYICIMQRQQLLECARKTNSNAEAVRKEMSDQVNSYLGIIDENEATIAKVAMYVLNKSICTYINKMHSYLLCI